jgi:hypothetical protein
MKSTSITIRIKNGKGAKKWNTEQQALKNHAELNQGVVLNTYIPVVNYCKITQVSWTLNSD